MFKVAKAKLLSKMTILWASWRAWRARSGPPQCGISRNFVPNEFFIFILYISQIVEIHFDEYH